MQMRLSSLRISRQLRGIFLYRSTATNQRPMRTRRSSTATMIQPYSETPTPAGCERAHCNIERRTESPGFIPLARSPFPLLAPLSRSRCQAVSVRPPTRAQHFPEAPLGALELGVLRVCSERGGSSRRAVRGRQDTQAQAQREQQCGAQRAQQPRQQQLRASGQCAALRRCAALCCAGDLCQARVVAERVCDGAQEAARRLRRPRPQGLAAGYARRGALRRQQWSGEAIAGECENGCGIALRSVRATR